jgi:hypothetical protein
LKNPANNMFESLKKKLSGLLGIKKSEKEKKTNKGKAEPEPA